MFIYRPPKSSCWGHALGKDPVKAQARLDTFIATFFDRVELQTPTTLVLAWKDAVLPKVEWPEPFLGPDRQKWRQCLFMVIGGRVAFPLGILFPLSLTDPASFAFLGRFSTEAPFRMSAKHFMVSVVNRSGKVVWRRPDDSTLARLEEFVV